MIADTSITWFGEHWQGGELLARFGRRGPELFAELTKVGKFIAEVGRPPRFEPAVGVAPAAVQKVRDSLVGAFVRHLEGKITLHGSAVGFGSRAIAMVGESRAGKSTMAAAMCAVGEAQLVADDTVAIELPNSAEPSAPVTVLPTQKVAWLLPESLRAFGMSSELAGKIPVAFPVTSRSELRLAAIVALVFDNSLSVPVLRRVRGLQAFSILAHSAIRFVVDDSAYQLREFEQFSRLSKCPVFELRRRSDLGRLEQAGALLREVAKNPAMEQIQ